MRGMWILLLVGVACGGRVVDPDGGSPAANAGDREAGSGQGVGSGSGELPCPLLPPEPGDPCSYPAGEVCAYVGGGLPCQAAECDGSGHWVATHDGC